MGLVFRFLFPNCPKTCLMWRTCRQDKLFRPNSKCVAGMNLEFGPVKV
jgi:hypothetical protein